MTEQTIKAVVENSMGFVWLVVIALWGGTASYLGRIKKTSQSFCIMELVGEWTISGFAGIITAYVCTHFELSFFMTAAATGISGHMGGRAIFLIENFIKYKAASVMNIDEKENKR